MKSVKIIIKRSEYRRNGWLSNDFYYDIELDFKNLDSNPFPDNEFVTDYNKIKLIKKIFFNNRTYALLFMNDEDTILKNFAFIKIHFDLIKLELYEKQFKSWKITEKGVKNDLC